MGITAYSVIVSVLLYNVSLLAVYLLRRSGAVRAKHTSALLLLLTFLAVARLLMPFDVHGSHVIRSYKVLPAIERGLTFPLLGPFRLGGILLIVWAVGTFFFVLRDLSAQLRFLRAKKDLPLRENEQISRIAAQYGKGFALKISPEIDLPFVTGLFKPVIYVPDIELSEQEWRNIFLHETQHIRSRDEWKKLLFRGIRALFWWNPLAHVSEKDIDLLIELQCDNRVAGKGDLDEQETYLRTMLTLMRRRTDAKVPALAARMIGKGEEMQIRFEALLAKETKRSRVLSRILPVLMAAAFFASYFVILQPAGFPSNEEVVQYGGGKVAADYTEVINGDIPKYILIEDGEYHLYINGEYFGTLYEEMLSLPPYQNVPIIENDEKGDET
ncbi:MAG: M56 family metallopeptidase [Oscillospiraceae bacterium]|nr:M56 family metallopeptidase [Oscillospiraceae bacterium]